MIINHNLPGSNAIRQMNVNSANSSKSMQKLSSGLRINSAADDAAGLAISEKMRGQIRGLDQASSNAQDAISLTQTAEGALSETTSILQRMRELAVQSATDTNTDSDREKIQSETDQLAKEITRISNTTEFNTQNLLAGGLDNTFQIGANKNQNINLQVGAMDAFSLGVAGSTVTSANFDDGTAGAGDSGINSVSNVGRGFSTGTGYNIDVTVTSATYSSALVDNGTTGTQDVASGAVTINGATNYTGTEALNYKVKANGLTGNDLSSVLVSTNGGSSWSTVNGVDGGAGTWTYDLGNGLTLSATDGVGVGAYVIGDEYDFSVTPKTATLQLQDGSSNNIGTATTVKYGSTSAVVGDVANNKSLTANFAFTDLTTAKSATFDMTSDASTAATTVDGKITVEADTKAGIAVNTQSAANSAIETIDKAINTVSAERSKLGAFSNRLDHTIANLGTASENLTSAESRIRDVDMAKEMSTFSKNNILSQAAQAMLAQANSQPQQVLQLLR
jgi:flagellin